MDLSDSEVNQKRASEQKAYRRKVQRQAAKEAEDQQFIDAGRGSRGAKDRANQNAATPKLKMPAKSQSSQATEGPQKSYKTVRTQDNTNQTSLSMRSNKKRKDIKNRTMSDESDVQSRLSHESESGESSEEETEDSKSRNDSHDENGGLESDEDADEDGDENFSDAELQRQLKQEMPHISPGTRGGPETLFDDDEGVEFVPPRDRGSSPMEYPPTSSVSKKGSSVRTANAVESQKYANRSTPSRKNPVYLKQPSQAKKQSSQMEAGPLDLISGDSDTDPPLDYLPERLRGTQRKNRNKNHEKTSKRDDKLISERTSAVTSQVTKSSQSRKGLKHQMKKRESTPLSETRMTRPSDDSEEDKTDSSLPRPHEEKDWARVARLVGDKGTGLLQQNPHITALVHHCITIVLKEVHLTNPWREHHNWAAYRYEVLLKGINKLIKDNKLYSPIRTRIQVDAEFCSRVGKWFMDRIAGCRHAMIASARIEICGYRLGKGEECIERVHLLMQDDAYCHPGGFITSQVDKKMVYISDSTPAKDLKFLHPVIIDTIIGAFFASSTSSGWKYRDSYVTSLPDRPEHPEPEVPMAMVALAATAVRTAIWEMRKGVVPKTTKQAKKAGSHGAATQDQFSGNTVLGVYQGHINHLSQLKEKGRVSYHKLMAKIYEKIKSHDSELAVGFSNGNLTCAPLAGVDTSFLEN